MLNPYGIHASGYYPWAYDATIADILVEFTKLRHLAIPIFIKYRDGIDSSLVCSYFCGAYTSAMTYIFAVPLTVGGLSRLDGDPKIHSFAPAWSRGRLLVCSIGIKTYPYGIHERLRS